MILFKPGSWIRIQVALTADLDQHKHGTRDTPFSTVTKIYVQYMAHSVLASQHLLQYHITRKDCQG